MCGTRPDVRQATTTKLWVAREVEFSNKDDGLLMLSLYTSRSVGKNFVKRYFIVYSLFELRSCLILRFSQGGGYEEVHVFGPDYKGNETFRNITVAYLMFVLPPFLFFANKARKSQTRWKYLVGFIDSSISLFWLIAVPCCWSVWIPYSILCCFSRCDATKDRQQYVPTSPSERAASGDVGIFAVYQARSLGPCFQVWEWIECYSWANWISVLFTLTYSVSRPTGASGETNRKVAELVAQNLAKQLEGVEVLRMRMRRKVRLSIDKLFAICSFAFSRLGHGSVLLPVPWYDAQPRRVWHHQERPCWRECPIRCERHDWRNSATNDWRLNLTRCEYSERRTVETDISVLVLFDAARCRCFFWFCLGKCKSLECLVSRVFGGSQIIVWI